MTHTPWYRASVFLLMLALVAPAVAVAGGRESPRRDYQSGLAAMLWEALVRLVPAIESLGAGLDPAGAPAEGATTDLGPGLDPGGTPNG